MSFFLNNVGSHAKTHLLLKTNEKKKHKMSVRTFLPRALQLRRNQVTLTLDEISHFRLKSLK